MKLNATLRKDKVFRAAMKGISPIDLPSAGNVFNELVKAILYQQISVKAADTIYARFVDKLGTEEYRPAKLLKVPTEDLRALGLSSQKSRYVHNIATHFKEHKLYGQDWSTLSDEEIIQTLSDIKGVGEWTAQMILIFELHRPDVLPVKDLAIQQVMIELYALDALKPKALYRQMEAVAEAWRPHRTLATQYLYGWKRAQRAAAKEKKSKN